MDSIHNKYHSYMLRLWQVQEETGSNWRASLEDVQTRELHGFQDLAALYDFLEEQSFPKRENKKVLALLLD